MPRVAVPAQEARVSALRAATTHARARGTHSAGMGVSATSRSSARQALAMSPMLFWQSGQR